MMEPYVDVGRALGKFQPPAGLKLHYKHLGATPHASFSPLFVQAMQGG